MIKKTTLIFNFVIIVVSFVLVIIRINTAGIYDLLINIAIIPLLIIPFEIQKFIKISDISLFIYSIHVFIAVFLGSIINFYNNVPWFDTFAHTLYGFLFSFFALEFLFKTKNSKNIIISSILLLAIIALGAGLWETFEFTCDKIFNKDAQRVLLTGANDTMKDIIVAYIGSLIFILMYSYEYIYNKNWIIKKFVKQL